MFKDYAAFVAFALFLTSCCGKTSSECTKQTACSCVLEDGYGYDLTNLTNLGLLNVTQYGYTFHFQPCKNVKMSLANDSGECGQGKGVSLCANKTAASFINLGTTEETKFLLEPGKLPSLVLQHKDFTSRIGLSCCDQCKTHITVDQPVGNQYHLTLVTPSACKVLLHSRGLSTGSVLVILFFVFSGLYFIGGGIVLTLTRGATGWERLPNHEFWCELPSLVRDGIVFTFNCFRVDSYERI